MSTFIETIDDYTSRIDNMQGHMDFLPTWELSDAIDEKIGQLDEDDDHNQIYRLKAIVEAADKFRMAYEELQEATRDADLDSFQDDEDEDEDELEAA